MSKMSELLKRWQGRGYEKGETAPFWLDIMETCFNISAKDNRIIFEKKVKMIGGKRGFIDAYIPETKVLIEQKGSGRSLTEPELQSDGSLLTPYEQAQRYANALLYGEQPHWIVVCNFEEFHIYDLSKDKDKPVLQASLEEIAKQPELLNFLVNDNANRLIIEKEVSIKAGELVGRLYDSLLEQYKDKTSTDTLHSLNVLCVQLVFCLYADSARLFEKGQFVAYIQQYSAKDLRLGLIRLFEVLNTEVENRDPYLEGELAAFPYVNGGLFDMKCEIPTLTESIKDLLLNDLGVQFDWSCISPTIFGAVFESTLNTETRRSGGMHYTSIENIHKVIDPLFMNGLNAEYAQIQTLTQQSAIRKRLFALQKQIAELKFLDPACGSGNFLTETYISLRRLENKIIRDLYGEDMTILDSMIDSLIKVEIHQFYGIEINDFAVVVAKTALWIAESQMMKETAEVIHRDLEFLPLKSYVNIVEGNALRIPWEDVVPASELNYIMGNPPFVGFTFATKQQKDDMQYVFGGKIKPALLDFVCSWYEKAAEYITSTKCKCEVAFVSTDSVSQGQMVGDLWAHLFEAYQIQINFAYRSFVWSSQSTDEANVRVVIIGFATFARVKKFIYAENGEKQVKILTRILLRVKILL